MSDPIQVPGSMTDLQGLRRCVGCLLNSVSGDGVWGDFQREWDAVITATACDLLLSCGVLADTRWFVREAGYVECTLAKSFAWLNNAIQPTGEFGSDYWDATRLGLVIERHGLHAHFTAYPTLASYLQSKCEPEHFDSCAAPWRGPGFYASAAEYLLMVGERSRAIALLDLLATRQSDEGDWIGESSISPVWHSAQCILAMVAADRARYQDSISRGVERLAKTQGRDGSWSAIQQYVIYFTSYAILALACDPERYRDELARALSFLKSWIGPDGKCSDLGGTLMCALAIERVTRDSRPVDPSLADLVLTEKALDRIRAVEEDREKIRATCKVVRRRLRWYERKYRDADVVLTKRQAFILTVVALVITVLGAVVPLLLTETGRRHHEAAATTEGTRAIGSVRPPGGSGAEVDSTMGTEEGDTTGRGTRVRVGVRSGREKVQHK